MQVRPAQQKELLDRLNNLVIASRIFEGLGIAFFASALVAYRFPEIIWWYWILIGLVLIVAGIYYQENSKR